VYVKLEGMLAFSFYSYSKISLEVHLIYPPIHNFLLGYLSRVVHGALTIVGLLTSCGIFRMKYSYPRRVLNNII
jgi:hypothetical protein